MLRMVKYAIICIFTATLRALDPPPTNSLGKSTKKVLLLLPELSILYFQEISIQHQYSEYTRDILNLHKAMRKYHQFEISFKLRVWDTMSIRNYL